MKSQKRANTQKSTHSHPNDISVLSGKKIFSVTVLNATITLAEIIGAIVSGSLALLSDAVHNLSDTAAIALSYFAYKIAQRPADIKRTFGYRRAQILTAFVNCSILFAVSLVLIIEAVRRWMSPAIVNGTLMITVALVGLIANILSVLLLKKHSQDSLNIRSSYLHLLSDTVSSIGVLLGGVAIRLWGIVWIDPLITVLISIYILRETGLVIKKAVGILMQSSPVLDYESIKTDIEKLDKIKNIHHVHSWLSDEKTIYFEAHIEMEDILLSDAKKVCNEIEQLLKDRWGISHVTLQAEVDKCCDKNLFQSGSI